MVEIIKQNSSNEKEFKEESEFIDFFELQNGLKITNKELFYAYIKGVYKDLAERDDANKKMGIPKITFFDYFKLPVFISESLFGSFDTDKNGYLSIQEFGEGMSTLFLGSFEETVKLIFNIYDSNRDGLVHKEDVRLLLSYLPLKEDFSKLDYKYQLESQKEILEIINSTFCSTDQLSFKDYLKITECKKSDSFLQLLCFLYQKKPFNEENIKLLEAKKKKEENISSPKRVNDFSSPQNKKRIVSPTKMSCLSPTTNYLKKNKNTNCEGSLIKLCALKEEENFNRNPEISAYEGMVRMPNVKLNENHEDTIEKNIEQSINTFDSPTNFLRRLVPKKKNSI